MQIMLPFVCYPSKPDTMFSFFQVALLANLDQA
jgi:hypothetical protein